MERIRWWEDYVKSCGASLDNNPSPGNKEGGLTTILEKSLGAVAKGGSQDLAAVYEYAEPITAKGFVFMDTPGLRPGFGHRDGCRGAPTSSASPRGAGRCSAPSRRPA